MTIKSNDDALSRVNYDSNYHERAWVEFTTLTDQERKNLLERAKILRKIKLQTNQFNN